MTKITRNFTQTELRLSAPLSVQSSARASPLLSEEGTDKKGIPQQALRTLSSPRSCNRFLVLGALSWAFIAKSNPNPQKMTFD
jgi:hypothetical protein